MQYGSMHLLETLYINFLIKQVSEHHHIYGLTGCALITFKTSFSHLIGKVNIANVNNELFKLIKFFTDRCHKKKDFRLFSRLKKSSLKYLMKKESSKQKLNNKLEKARMV
jgi:hypothetical protein